MDHAAEVGRVGVPVFIKLIEDQELTFDGLAGSQAMVLKLVRGLDISGFSKASLVVRVSSQTFASTQTVTVEAVPVWPNPAVPETAFQAATTAGSVILSSGTSAAGKIYAVALSSQVGPALDLQVRAAQVVTPSAFSVVISVGLLAYE